MIIVFLNQFYYSYHYYYYFFLNIFIFIIINSMSIPSHLKVVEAFKFSSHRVYLHIVHLRAVFMSKKKLKISSRTSARMFSKLDMNPIPWHLLYLSEGLSHFILPELPVLRGGVSVRQSGQLLQFLRFSDTTY